MLKMQLIRAKDDTYVLFLLLRFIELLRPFRHTTKLPSFSVQRQISPIGTTSYLFNIFFYDVFPAHSWSSQQSFTYRILFYHCTQQQILLPQSMASPLQSSSSVNLQYVRTHIVVDMRRYTRVRLGYFCDFGFIALKIKSILIYQSHLEPLQVESI